MILVVFSALGLARFGYTSILPAMQEALKLSNTQTGVLQSWNLVGYLRDGGVRRRAGGALRTARGDRRRPAGRRGGHGVDRA